MGNGKIWQISALNSAILQTAATALTLCFVLIG